MHALTRAAPPSINRCELTHVTRTPIDWQIAQHQHHQYERTLQALGCEISRLAELPDAPDSVFVEDTAVVLDEVAVITRPGAESRREETASVAEVLRNYRPLEFVREPATLDGGDVLQIGKDIFVGKTARTNTAGIDQLRAAVSPHGYSVHALAVRGCLHLKTAVSQVAPDTLLFNPAWIHVEDLAQPYRIVEVDPSEPFAANALLIGGTVMFPPAYPKSARRLKDHGIELRLVDMSELAKAEGGLTCCSLIVADL